MVAEDVAQVDALARWLRETAPADVLAPVSRGGKAPIVKHAAPEMWTMASLARWRSVQRDHTDFAILMKTLCALDVDNHALAAELERRFPQLADAPCESTRRGRHYIFARSALADDDGYYDAIAPAIAGVDFKSRTCTGTGGVLVVAPSLGKTWIRAPWEPSKRRSGVRAPEIPEGLLRYAAVASHPPRALRFDCARGETFTRHECRHSARAPFVALFADDEIAHLFGDGKRWGACPDFTTESADDFRRAGVPRVLATDWSMRSVSIAVDAVESGVLREVDDLEAVADALTFCDFAGFADARVASVRDDHEESVCLYRTHPRMFAARARDSGVIHVHAEFAASAEATRLDTPADVAECEIGLRCHEIAPTPRSAIVSDPVAAMERELPRCVVGWLGRFPGDLVVAGGFVTGAISTGSAPGSDVDLFVVSASTQVADEILSHIRRDPNVYQERFTGHALTLTLAAGHARSRGAEVVQVVLALNRDVERLLRGFDIAPSRACAYASEGQRLVVRATPCWVESVRSMAFPILREGWTDSSVARIAKYCAKGFAAYVPGLDRKKVVERLAEMGMKTPPARGSMRTRETGRAARACRSSRSGLGRAYEPLARVRAMAALRARLREDRGLESLFAAEWFVAWCVSRDARREQVARTAALDLLRGVISRTKQSSYDQVRSRSLVGRLGDALASAVGGGACAGGAFSASDTCSSGDKTVHWMTYPLTRARDGGVACARTVLGPTTDFSSWRRSIFDVTHQK